MSSTPTYYGEHTLAGVLGHGLALASFGGALLALVSYFLFTRSNDAGWRSLGRIGFRLHAVAVVGIVVTLFVMLFNHWFEFDYVWKHSNRAMPLRYILSCFWEGQEGSFLLWTFWNMVLGNLLLRRAKEWEGPVMAVVALVQVFLATMLLGIYVFGIRIGSSPFLLIRELPENIGLPWTHLSDYLSRIPQFHDGRGLNPLLQNYWMVIHPPTLFLGFASTLVPFAFAIAALWKGRLTDWMAPVLPWTFFGVMVLGTGILMGGAWAYEALSFGGFWAWDPVENASLVPWLTLVGTGHLLLINKRKATSPFTTILLALGTFLLVLYSTFLTRSGVLGDSSVHSFTGEGMLPGLLVFMLAFVVLATAMLNRDRQVRWYYVLMSFGMLIAGAIIGKLTTAILLFAALTLVMTVVAYVHEPVFHGSEEERMSSREFWLFIGSLVLLSSAVQITWTTSIPVSNLLMAPLDPAAKLAPPIERAAHYNSWQESFAIVVALLVAVGQYLRYKDTDLNRFVRELTVSFVLALVITGVGVWWFGYVWREGQLVALFFATTFAALANASYIRTVLKGSLKKAGPSVAHVGFSLVLLGALISTGRQETITRTVKGPSLATLNEGFHDDKDMLLYLGDTLPVGDHFVTFRQRRHEGVDLFFDMDYLRAVPRKFHQGDTVRVRNSVFVARDDHTAGHSFMLDLPHWDQLDSAPLRVFWHSPVWTDATPGEKEFSLAPLVQLNPRFGNVAEPSTRHRLDHDLYTHIRYAKLEDDSTDYMPPREVELNAGDTVVTATCILTLDSIRTVEDSVTQRRLGPEFRAYAPTIHVCDRNDLSHWFESRAVIVYHGDGPVGGRGFEVPALKMKVELTSVAGQHVKLNVSEREFVIMQAIVFPGINILWIGCILMGLGSAMAIWQRVRRR